jgi:hypothetical protein
MRTFTTMFDRKVSEWRGKVPLRQTHKPKTACTPKQWAAKLDYQALRSRIPENKRAISESNKRWRNNNLERERAKGREKSRRERRRDPELTNDRTRRWRINNPDRAKRSQRKSDRKWKAANPGYTTVYFRHRRLRDPAFRLQMSLRSRTYQAFKSGKLCHTTTGLSWEGLRQYIEMLWKPGMSHDNYGKKALQWSIDHWFPISKIDTKRLSHQLAVNHFTNLSPLWNPENDSKGDEVYPAAEAHFLRLVERFEQEIKQGGHQCCIRTE